MYEVERDAVKYWKQSGVRIACLGLENQTAPDPYMALRALAYDGASYRTQLRKSNKDKPKFPVATLVLYFGYEKRWDKPITLHDTFDIPKELKTLVPDYKVNLFEIAWLDEDTVKLFHSDFRVVADYFVQKRKNGNYVPSSFVMDHVEEVMDLLSVMEQDDRFKVMYREAEKAGGANTMCDVIDNAINRGKQAQATETVDRMLAMGVFTNEQIAEGVGVTLEFVLERAGQKAV